MNECIIDVNRCHMHIKEVTSPNKDMKEDRIVKHAYMCGLSRDNIQ